MTITSVVFYSDNAALATKHRAIGEPLYKKYKSFNIEPFWSLSKDGFLNGDVSENGRKLAVKTFVCAPKDVRFCGS